MAGAGEMDAYSLEFTPTWVVALVCSIIVCISLGAERLLHSLGKFLKRKNQKPLFEALQKIKEELMLLGFIAVLLSVFQNTISKICIHESWTNHLLPCNKSKLFSSEGNNEYCTKGKVPLLSTEALHHLHIFIFVLAIVHVTFCVLTVIFGGIKIGMWKQWEDSIAKDKCNTTKHLNKVIDVHQPPFIQDNFLISERSILAILGWLSSCFKQFYGSVNKSVYITLRLGFITAHCPEHPKLDYLKYMVRALEADFKKVVGISWYLWIFVVFFLLLNVEGWHAYFWISFIPLFLLVAVGAKLQHIISQLAREVAKKQKSIEGDSVVTLANDNFWFSSPRIVLLLIHFILFQNAFEFAIFFWIWVQFGFESCIMGQVWFIIPRLEIGVFILVLCSYSTLPLYAIVTQMGSSFNIDMFEKHIHIGLVSWANKARLRAAARNGSTQGGTAHQGESTKGSSTTMHIPKGEQPEPAEEIAKEVAGDIEASSTTMHIPMGLMGEQPEPAQEIAKEDAGDIAVIIDPSTEP